jgi:hypothetical protein
MSTVSEKTVSVVIPHYYPEREPNLWKIVDAFNTGTIRPLEILIWCNSPLKNRALRLQTGVQLFLSPRNVGAQGRFLAALAARGEFVFFLDNDVAPQVKTLENILEWQKVVARNSVLSSILTLEGRIALYNKPYSSWPKKYGHGLVEAMQVELSLGRGELVCRKDLPHILSDFPFDPSTVMDDLWFSAGAMRIGRQIWVVPCKKGESALTDLPMYGTGLCMEPAFYAERDLAIKQIALKAIQERVGQWY